MKWLELLERRKALLVGGVAVICIAALLVTARRFNITLDVYWHIKTGFDWLTQGLSPWQDHYSFTFYGEAIKSQAYIFQALIGWLVSRLGVESGLEIFRMASFLTVFALVLLFLRNLKSRTVAYLLILPMLTLLLQQRPVARPELISYCLIVLAVMLYHRARFRMTASTMLPIILLVWAWNNYHSAIFGYVIFFGLFVDTAVRFLRERAPAGQWLQWIGWGLTVVAVGALKPGFQIPFMGLFFSSSESFSAEWKDLILEYVSLPTKLASTGLIFELDTYAIGILAAVTLVLAASRRYFGLVIVCGILIYSAIDMSRLVTPNGIALLCILAWMMSEIDLAEFVRNRPPWVTLAIGTAALAIFGLSLYSVVWMARGNMALNRTFTTGFPKDVTDYMIENDISGRIFNDYEDGGYLIYRLAPDSLVYIDGRTNILYPVEHARRSLEARIAPDILVEEVDKYGIDLALLNNSKRNFSLVQDTNRLKLDYVGFEHSLFRKDDPNFPLLGLLLARPACWSPQMAEDLLVERNRAIDLLPERSPAIGFIEFLAAYSTSADKLEFMSDVKNHKDWNDYSLRFAGYQALSLGLPDLAQAFFAAIRTGEFADYLAVALAKIGQEDLLDAERALDKVTRINWAAVKESELKILYRLLEQIRANTQLELFDEGYVDGLAQQFEESGGSLSRPSIHSFCPEN